MCLIVIGIDAHPDYPLILLGNRDEFYERPTKNFFFLEREGILCW